MNKNNQQKEMPVFETKRRVGQYNLPTWNSIEKEFGQIFERQYYTNHGPLAIELENKLSKRFSVKHTICMANETIALMIAYKALGAKGKIICPAFAPREVIEALNWTGYEPVYVALDKNSLEMDISQMKSLITDDVTAVLGVHLWGNHNCSEIQKVARENNLTVLFYDTHSLGLHLSNNEKWDVGDLAIYSFHETELINAGEGGCICTNDDALAAKIRNMRSSYGAGFSVPIPLTGNGRMSEAQAAIALQCLSNLPTIQQRNSEVFRSYTEFLQKIPGIEIFQFKSHQHVIIQVREEYSINREELEQLLNRNNICTDSFSTYLGADSTKENGRDANLVRSIEVLSKNIIQLPSGQDVSLDDVRLICSLIETAGQI
jgi:dTDP-4-amino-4,6-dideoxygalactose transaminase